MSTSLLKRALLKRVLTKKSVFVGVVTLVLSPTLFASGYAGPNYKIELQNITTGAYFTPFLIAAHPESANLFDVGSPASLSIQKVAEGGDLSGVVADVAGMGAKYVTNPAGGLLFPGKKAVAELGHLGYGNNMLSIVAMLVPSNDTFVGLDSLRLPVYPGTYTYMVNVYDAGTEANDEIRGSGMVGVPGMAVPPPLSAQVGVGGTGIPNAKKEGIIALHPGVIGDSDLNGGISDLDVATHRWPNPALKVTITVSYDRK